ncbi:uncharacterized protein [Pocillopora verrucosa]|uniref:uncharacterized protein isoform X4 n=1 Tax=Pocillopora verrucosa TaxID=203993 RepID=UPI003341B347
MMDGSFKLVLKLQTPLGGFQSIFFPASHLTIFGILQSYHANDRLNFNCDPKPSNFIRQLCYDNYISTVTKPHGLIPRNVVAITFSVLCACWIGFAIYGVVTLRKRPGYKEKNTKKFLYAYFIHVFFRIFFLGVMLGLVCSYQTIFLPSVFKCGVKEILQTNSQTTPSSLNQTKLKLQCNDLHYKEKSYLNITFISVDAFFMVVSILEVLHLYRIRGNYVQKLLGDLEDFEGQELLQSYDQELADFYVSLQPCSTGSGRPQSSGSTEVKQEEDSGSAAQKHKFDPIGEPETSGVSSSSKRRKFEVPMEGVISQLVDVKMEPDTVQHLELKKDLLRDVEEIERSVIFRGEVTEKGNVWNLPEAAAYVTFHEGAVPKPLLFTCSVWPPKLRSPPISSDELLVSNVIELSHDGPPDLELSGDDEGNVTVALLHSASDLKGYEVVIKQLVDLHDNEWKDLETWHASGAEKPEVSDWPQLVEATCTPSRFSSFAAVWRLKSFTFTSGTLVVPQFICVVPDFPEIRVEVPLGSVPVDQDFTLTIKVQEFPSSEVEDIGILCGPVIHISSSQNIEHMEPVTIKVPLALRESKHDLSELSNEVIRIYFDSEGKQWRDITGQLEGPVTVKDGIVEFKVKHFSCFCPVCMFTESVALLQDFFYRLSFRLMPQCVHFLTCLCNTTVPDTYSLSLYCYPNFKKAEVEKKLSRYDTPYQGEGKSKEPACVGDRIVVSLIALDFVRESQRNQKLVLRFLGNDISDNSDMALIVRLDSEGVPIVKFSKDEELQKVLCEVPILKTRPASVVQIASWLPQVPVVPEERPALVADVEKEEKDNEDQCNPRVKQGTPSDDELEYLASKLSDLWKKLGRRLKILEPKLDDLHKLNEALSEKGYKMLRHWKEVNGSAATYEILGHALLDRLVNRRDLAEEFCYEKQ